MIVARARIQRVGSGLLASPRSGTRSWAQRAVEHFSGPSQVTVALISADWRGLF